MTTVTCHCHTILSLLSHLLVTSYYHYCHMSLSYYVTVFVKIIAIQHQMQFSKNSCFRSYYTSHYFSEGVQLVAEVARSQFLLVVFISQQAFPHLLISHYFYVYSSTLYGIYSTYSVTHCKSVNSSRISRQAYWK